MTYDNNKSHKKREFHPLFRRYIFRKTTFPSAVLGLSKFSCDVIIWSFFLITWYRASLHIKREAWFLIGVYLNNHIWLSILAIESLIFRQTFFPWNVSVNFRINKCHSHTKMPDYFGSYLLAFIKKLFIFRTYPLVTLIKYKLQIHPAIPANPDISKFITKFL